MHEYSTKNTQKKGSDTISDGTPSKIYSSIYCPKSSIFFKDFFLWLIDLGTFQNERQNTKKPSMASIYSVCQIIRQDCQRIRQKTGKIIRQVTACAKKPLPSRKPSFYGPGGTFYIRN